MIRYQLKKTRFNIIVLLTLVIVSLCALLFYSFAFFEFKSEKYDALNVKVGDLNYNLSGIGLLHDNTYSIKSNSTDYLSLLLVSNNNIDTKYVISYYCNNCDELKVYKSSTSINDVNDVIKKNTTNTINLVIENNSDNDYNISFTIDAGYFYNNLDSVSNIVDLYPSHNIVLNISDPLIGDSTSKSIIDDHNTANVFYDSKVGYDVNALECNTTNEYYYDETYRKLVIKDIAEDTTCNLVFEKKSLDICGTSIQTKENNITYNLINNNLIKKICDDTSEIYEGLLFKDNSLIFRGNINNNYISINNMLWRIVSINSNGNIKIVLNDSIKDITFGNNMLINNTGIYNTMNEWYKNNLLLFDELIVNSSYYYDTSISLNDVYYGSYYRNINNAPKYTFEENSFINKIGLLTIDEILLAGYDKSYLKTTNDNSWWTLSPYSIENDINNIFVFNEKDGSLSYKSSLETSSFKPVINILGSVKVSGEGTIENPFIIE